jgi:hypothetical protein
MIAYRNIAVTLCPLHPMLATDYRPCRHRWMERQMWVPMHMQRSLRLAKSGQIQEYLSWWGKDQAVHWN